MPLFDALRVEPGEGFDMEMWGELLDSLETLALTIPNNTNGEIINDVTIGTKPGDGSEMNYPWAFETIGVSKKNRNLRLQSPNSVFVHTNIDGNEQNNTAKVPLTIHKNGNVGVGTTDPKKLLHIKGDAGLINLEGKTHAYLQYYPKGYASGRKAFVGFGSPSGANQDAFYIYNQNKNKLYLGTDDKTRLAIDQDGNVGIGTASPKEKLQVAGTVMCTLVKGSGTNGEAKLLTKKLPDKNGSVNHNISFGWEYIGEKKYKGKSLAINKYIMYIYIDGKKVHAFLPNPKVKVPVKIGGMTLNISI